MSEISFDSADPEIHWILGRPGFVCGPIAALLRLNGHEIPRRCEDEQAAVIVWMICVYQAHGSEWKTEGDKILKGINDAYFANQKEALANG